MNGEKKTRGMSVHGIIPARTRSKKKIQRDIIELQSSGEEEHREKNRSSVPQ